MEKCVYYPSYQNYAAILELLKQTGKYMDYTQVEKDTSEFVLMRHDIEFSIERAFAMAELEAENGICSTYLVQITNNAYNAFSQKNLMLLEQMCDMGHHVGLHFHMGGLTELSQIMEEIPKQAEILSKMLRRPVDRFSFHRPQVEVLRANLQISGLVNLYDKRFFTFSENADKEENLDVKYISDSRHQWNFGMPNCETLHRYKKVHLLVHPYSWTSQGMPNVDNFYSLVQEKQDILFQTLNSECKHFSEAYQDLQIAFGHRPLDRKEVIL